MTTVKYAEDDIVPLVLNVLSFIIKFSVGQMLLVTFEEEYADLQGLVKADSVDAESVRLLIQSDDDAVKMSLTLVDEMLLCMEGLAAMHQLNIEEVVNDKRLIELAEPIFWSTACYIDDAEGYNKSVNNMYVYFGSVSMFMPLFCNLLKDGKLKIEDCKHTSAVYCMPDDIHPGHTQFFALMKHLERSVVAYLRNMESFLMDLYFLNAK
ncbi:hypothetical protein ACSBL2_24470 [Pedobacter sp. AW31-3R]|uniref:hypothetical protein n=1 Tax=Pedobacter sp. AW31-3R TaxID=3445781 RepID=UPI003F9F0C51